MKKIVFLLGFTMCMLFSPLLGFEHVQAGPAGGEVLDNDDAQGGRNMYSGSWGYGTYSADYRGDHRLYTSSSGDGQYYWKFKYYSGGRKYSVYLNNYAFTDPRATYYTADDYSGVSFKTINQDTSPGGWNLLNSVPVTAQPAHSYLMVDASGSGNTGADGAIVDYY